jgi:hypothetical protein
VLSRVPWRPPQTGQAKPVKALICWKSWAGMAGLSG